MTREQRPSPRRRRWRITDAGAEVAWKWSCRALGSIAFGYLVATHPTTTPPQTWIAVAGFGGFGDVIARSIRQQKGPRGK